MPPAAKRFVKICVDNTEQAKRLKKMSAEEEDENVVYVQKSEYDYGFDGPSVKEVPFVRGEIDGLFTWRWSSGNFLETPYVRGVIHGVERERKSANLTIETPYVYGLKHGVKRTTWPDVFIEVPYAEEIGGAIGGVEAGFWEGGKYYQDEAAREVGYFAMNQAGVPLPFEQDTYF